MIENERKNPFIISLFAMISFLLLGMLLVVLSLTVLFTRQQQQTHQHAANIQHYEYIFPDGWMYVYDMDHNQALVKSVRLPTTKGVRGPIANAATGMLYISYGSDGPSGTGYLLKYNLVTDQIVWNISYPFPVDTISITPDGKTIYQAGGEKNPLGIWHIINAATGKEIGDITSPAGSGPHNTIVSLNGSHVYMGGLNTDYLIVADTASNRVIKQIGPLEHGAGRPFTINGKETLLFTTGSNSFGFQVSDIPTGKVLYTVPIKGFSPSSFCCPYNHGISLSPNEKELYVMDGPNSYVHVFNVSGLPTVPPKQIADIPVTQITGSENPCIINCGREGWLQHSLDGRFVYVGDAGDVIDTATRKAVAHLAPLRNTRKFLEIDWQNGWPLFTSQTKGVGYVTHPLPGSTSTSSMTNFPTVPISPSKPTNTQGELVPLLWLSLSWLLRRRSRRTTCAASWCLTAHQTNEQEQAWETEVEDAFQRKILFLQEITYRCWFIYAVVTTVGIQYFCQKGIKGVTQKRAIVPVASRSIHHYRQTQQGSLPEQAERSLHAVALAFGA